MANFDPPQLQNSLIYFDEMLILELSPKSHLPRKISFRSDDVGGLSKYTQFATVTEKTLSGVRVSSGSAETLVRRRGTTNHRSIAYSLSNISAKDCQYRLMCVEVIVCNISVVFETQCTCYIPSNTPRFLFTSAAC